MRKPDLKVFKFKSLAMRIWTTFTIMILIIILSISLLYLFAYRMINENEKVQDLKVAHDVILQTSNYDGIYRFDEIRNLKGSDHFIYTVEGDTVSIEDINMRKDNDGGADAPPGINNSNIQSWMTAFVAEGEVSQVEYREKKNKVEIIYIISSIEVTDSKKVYLISSTPNMEDASILYMMISIGLFFIVVSFFAAKIVAKRISRPLKDLEDYTVRIARKDWGEEININNEDEIGRLAEAMNQMQNELKKAEEEEKMFLQSISHDLKTPVMVIMSHADAIIDGVYIESVEKTAEIIRDESISLEKKIKQILYLNTLDYVMENNKDIDVFNIRDMLFHIVNRFEVINSNIEWELDIDNVSMEGNKEKIQVAIENILENALRYVDGIIRIRLKQEDEAVVLEIYNDGPKIAEKHVNHIFDNMYKDKTGNFGLGLAITKKIINFHNGEIKALNRDAGVSFVIKL